MAAHQIYFVWLQLLYGRVEQRNMSRVIYCYLLAKISWKRQSDAQLSGLLVNPHLNTGIYSNKRACTQEQIKQLQNICRGQTPTFPPPSTPCLHVSSGPTLAPRKINSPPRPRDALTNTHRLLRQLLLWCRSFLSGSLCSSMEQLLLIRNRRKHRISTLSCTQ